MMCDRIHVPCQWRQLPLLRQPRASWLPDGDKLERNRGRAARTYFGSGRMNVCSIDLRLLTLDRPALLTVKGVVGRWLTVEVDGPASTEET